jgi:hypothetical protein
MAGASRGVQGGRRCRRNRGEGKGSVMGGVVTGIGKCVCVVVIAVVG